MHAAVRAGASTLRGVGGAYRDRPCITVRAGALRAGPRRRRPMHDVGGSRGGHLAGGGERVVDDDAVLHAGLRPVEREGVARLPAVRRSGRGRDQRDHAHEQRDEETDHRRIPAQGAAEMAATCAAVRPLSEPMPPVLLLIAVWMAEADFPFLPLP